MGLVRSEFDYLNSIRICRTFCVSPVAKKGNKLANACLTFCHFIFLTVVGTTTVYITDLEMGGRSPYK